MTNKENLLVIAMEECSELQQAIAKGIRFGLDNHHPDTPEITNEVQILTEFYHIQAIMDMLWDESIVRPNIVSEEDVIFNKRRNVKKYKNLSIKLGLIKD